MATLHLCLMVLLAAHVRSDTTLPVTTETSTSSGSPTTSVDPSPSPSATTTQSTSTTPLPCPDVDIVRKNNWPEDQEGTMISQDARGITNVSWASYDPASEYIDASSYVDVTYDETEQKIYFTALPSMKGVRDYPAMGYPQLSQLGGTVHMVCGSDTGEFDFRATVKDANTSTPHFSAPTYTVDVPETLPNGYTIPGLVISASDADAEVKWYEVTFSLQGDTPFGLTEKLKTGDVLPTYTTQLELTGPLDWTTKNKYQLTVTAMNGDEENPGPQSEATITVNIIDMDTMQPEFESSVFYATVDKPEVPGTLSVSITARDPDAPGSDKLLYTLNDTSSGGDFDDYFSLDPHSAELRLEKDITRELKDYERTVNFLLTAKEDGGSHFTCQSALVITLPAKTVTTTTEPPTTSTTMTSTEATSTTSDTPTTEVTSSTSETPTPTSDVTTPTSSTSPLTSTEPTTPTPSSTTDITTSTPVTSSTSTDTTLTPRTSTDTTVVTSSTSTDTPITSPVTSSSTPVTSATPTPTPTPVACPLFLERQYLADAPETFTGDVVTVSAVPAAGDVTYFLRTPGYDDSFSLDESSGTLKKLKKLAYQRVSLLVQAIPAGGTKKDQTNDTNIVDWDETLVIVDVTDENNSPPVLNCASYAASCDRVTIGFPASETASLPAPLLRLTVTDDDTGIFGVEGIQYSVDSTALEIDSSGMLYLVKQQSAAFSVSITAKDNNGGESSNKDVAHVDLVPVRDDQVFHVKTDDQLTSAAKVAQLLDQIAADGGYSAVFSLDFQALSTADAAQSGLGLTDSAGGSTIYIYALREGDDGAIAAVDSGDIEGSLNNMDKVDYIETKEDQLSGGPGDSDTTGLIAAVAVLACLLVAVIVAAALRQRQLLKRTSTSAYAQQNNDSESYSGGLKNTNYSPSGSKRGSLARPGVATYSNHAFQDTEQPVSSVSSAPDSGWRPAPYPSHQEEPVAAAAPRPLTPPAAPTATLIDLEPEPEPEPRPEPEPEPEEPTPDYSLKSVGFKETVICVSPPMEAHEEEEEEDEEEEEQEEREKAEAGDGAHEQGSPDQERKTSDGGGADNNEDSML